MLTHWGRVAHICIGKLTIIGSDNGLSPERRQAIIWTNAGLLLLTWPLGTNSIEVSIEFKHLHSRKCISNDIKIGHFFAVKTLAKLVRNMEILASHWVYWQTVFYPLAFQAKGVLLLSRSLPLPCIIGSSRLVLKLEAIVHDLEYNFRHFACRKSTKAGLCTL